MDFAALDLDDPRTRFWLGMSSGLLQAGGASRLPVGIGEAIGQGMQSGLGQYSLAQKMKQQNEMANLHANLYKAQAGKLNQDAQRQQRLAQIMNATDGNATAGASPADTFRIKGTMLLKEGFTKEGGDLIESANKLDNNLEFKDGIWYDKRTGRPVSGGAGINPQGFGYQTNVGPNGQISMGVLPGAADVYGTQQDIGEAAKARRDLVTVPATSPNSPPTFTTRERIVNPGAVGAPVAAGMAPAVAAQQAADAEQQKAVSLNFGKVYTDLQNAAMTNPAKIGKYQQIGNLLDGFEGGKLSQSGVNIASAANSAGIKLDPKLPNKEAAAALSNEIALDMRSTANGGGMPGAMSDQDREFLKSMAPNLSQTNEGRKQIIGAKVKLLERESQVAKMARQYRQKYKTLNDDFFTQLQDWSNRNPIFK